MQAHRRITLLGLLVLAGASALLLGGAASGAIEQNPACSSGRPFCVTVAHQDARSLSTQTSPHYMLFEVTVENTGGSTLTNGTLTLTLKDIVGGTISGGTVLGGASQDSTARLQGKVGDNQISDSRCTASVSSPHIVTCTVPNLPAGTGGTATYKPLVFRTSTTTTTTPSLLDDATGTEMSARASFKEKGSDNQPNDPQQDEATAVVTSTYEPDDNLDVSWAFPTAVINLQTSPTADTQHTSFPLTIPPEAPSFTASVSEGPIAGSFCPTCFGEIVTTNTGGNSATLFSASRPAHVVITWDFLPSGKTKNNIVVNHQRDGETTGGETITAPCTFGTNGVPTTLPCRDVTINRLGGGQVEVIISAYSDGNGSWGVG